MVVGDMANFSFPNARGKAKSANEWDHPSTVNGVKNFVHGMISPFTACWQPDFAACVPGCGPDYRRRKFPPEGSPAVVSPLLDRINPAQYEIPVSPVTSRYQGEKAAPPQDDESIVATTATDIAKPHQNDVLCGRGGSSNRHLGNMHFRELVAANKKVYVGLTKKQKMLVARKIVEMVHSTNPPGRFLAKDLDTGLWYDIGLPRSLEKTSQALREKNSNDYPTEQGVEVSEVLSDTSLTYSPRSDSRASSPTAMDDETEKSGKAASRSSKYVEAPPLTIPPHLMDVFGPKKAHSQDVHPTWPDYSPSRHLEQPHLHNYPPSPRADHYNVPYRQHQYDVPPRSPHRYHGAPPHYSHPDHPPHYHHTSYGPPEPPVQDYREHYDYYPRRSDPREQYAHQMSPHRAKPPPPHMPHYRAYPPPPPPPGPPPRPYRPQRHPPPMSPLHGRPRPAPEPHHYNTQPYPPPQYPHTSLSSVTPPSTPSSVAPATPDDSIAAQSPSNGSVRSKSEVSPERRQEWKRQRDERGVPRRLNSDASLSRAVENSLTLEERVVGRERATSGTTATTSTTRNLMSPSGTLQGRSRPRGGEKANIPVSGSSSLAAASGIAGMSLTEKEGDAITALSGLAALSTAAFLKLDETD